MSIIWGKTEKRAEKRLYLSELRCNLSSYESVTTYKPLNCLGKNCLLQRVIERKIKGKIEVTRRRGRRRGKLLDDLKERRRY